MAARSKSRGQARAAVVPFPRGRRGRGRLAELLPSSRSLAAGISLLVLAGGGYAAARTTAVFAIREIRVEGATPGLARAVRESVRPLAGSSLVALDGGNLVGRVEAIPEVLSAEYDRAFPHTLVVRVERELPAAVLRRGSESWLVSARGRAIREVPRGSSPRLPRVWVPRRVAVDPGAIVAAPHALRALRAVSAAPPGTLPSLVRTVRVDDRELTFQLASGLELRLGSEADLALKLAVAAEIIPALAPRWAGGPRYLDVEVPERAVAGPNPQVGGLG